MSEPKSTGGEKEKSSLQDEGTSTEGQQEAQKFLRKAIEALPAGTLARRMLELSASVLDKFAQATRRVVRR